MVVSCRVQGLPIGDCAGSSNNFMPRSAKLSAIDVTRKLFFERLYWFQDWDHLSPESTVRMPPHPHCSVDNYFSISVQFFSDVAVHFLSAHDSPSNLAKSRYSSTLFAPKSEGPKLAVEWPGGNSKQTWRGIVTLRGQKCSRGPVLQKDCAAMCLIATCPIAMTFLVSLR